MFPSPASNEPRKRPSLAGELSGAFGDLGTFAPHVLGAITVAGLAPGGVLLGFGTFLVATGLFYGIPIPVQPMKAISAVLLTGSLSPGEVMLSGIVIGAVLLLLGASGAIASLARWIPQTITTGLQLGLGVSMAILGLQLAWGTPWLGLFSLALLFALLALRRCPAIPLMLAIVVGLGFATGDVAPRADAMAFGWSFPSIVQPSWHEIADAIQLAALPQLPLTLTNAVIVTAALSRELYPASAARASERNLAVTSGLANLLLAPLGAMPMCHGAGGLQAQHRFGARTGWAPVIFGTVLLFLALGMASGAAPLLAMIPSAAVGAMLVLAGGDLALSRRLFDARPSCWIVIGLVAAATLVLNPAIAVVLGAAAETGRTALRRARRA